MKGLIVFNYYYSNRKRIRMAPIPMYVRCGATGFNSIFELVTHCQTLIQITLFIICWLMHRHTMWDTPVSVNTMNFPHFCRWFHLITDEHTHTHICHIKLQFHTEYWNEKLRLKEPEIKNTMKLEESSAIYNFECEVYFMSMNLKTAKIYFCCVWQNSMWN